MPTAYIGFTLKPNGFFTANPANDVPPSAKKSGELLPLRFEETPPLLMRAHPIENRRHAHRRGHQLRVRNGGRGLLGMAEGNHAIPLAVDDQRRADDSRGHFIGHGGELDHVVVEPLLDASSVVRGFSRVHRLTRRLPPTKLRRSEATVSADLQRSHAPKSRAQDGREEKPPEQGAISGPAFAGTAEISTSAAQRSAWCAASWSAEGPPPDSATIAAWRIDNASRRSA